jgi:hypothetical protein
MTYLLYDVKFGPRSGGYGSSAFAEDSWGLLLAFAAHIPIDGLVAEREEVREADPDATLPIEDFRPGNFPLDGHIPLGLGEIDDEFNLFCALNGRLAGVELNTTTAQIESSSRIVTGSCTSSR